MLPGLTTENGREKEGKCEEKVGRPKYHEKMECKK
jgi:hypothetical protein